MIEIYFVPLVAFVSSVCIGLILRRRRAWGTIGWLLTASVIAAVWMFFSVFAGIQTDHMVTATLVILLFLCLLPGVLGFLFGIWVGRVQAQRAVA